MDRYSEERWSRGPAPSPPPPGEDIGVIRALGVSDNVLQIHSTLSDSTGFSMGRVLYLRLDRVESIARFSGHHQILIRTTSSHVYRANCENLTNLSESVLAIFGSSVDAVSYLAETIQDKRKRQKQSEPEPEPEPEQNKKE